MDKEFEKVGSGIPENISGETLESMYSISEIGESFRLKENVALASRSKFRRSLENFAGGALEAIERKAVNMKDTYSLVRGNTLMSLGGEDVEVGRALVKTAKRNIDNNNRLLELKYFGGRAQSDKEGFARMLGAGASDLSLQIGLAIATTPAVAIGAMAVQEYTGELEKRLENQDLDKYTSADALRNSNLSAIYAAGSAYLEKRLGLDPLVNRIFKGSKPIIAGGKGVVSEGATEFLQANLSTALRLSDKTITWDDLPEELRNNAIEGVIGGILGGSASVGFATYNRARMINYVENKMGNALADGGDPRASATAIVDGLLDSASQTITSELVGQSELGMKQGVLFESLQTNIGKMIEKSGLVFENEADKQKYIYDNAFRVADWSMAEALQRNVPLAEVMDADNIWVDKDGGLHFSKMTEYEALVEKKYLDDLEAKQASLTAKIEAKKAKQKALEAKNKERLEKAREVQFNKEVAFVEKEKAKAEKERAKKELQEKRVLEAEIRQLEKDEKEMKKLRDKENPQDFVSFVKSRATNLYNEAKKQEISYIQSILKESSKRTKKDKRLTLNQAVKAFLSRNKYRGIGYALDPQKQEDFSKGWISRNELISEETKQFANWGYNDKRAKLAPADELAYAMYEEGYFSSVPSDTELFEAMNNELTDRVVRYSSADSEDTNVSRINEAVRGLNEAIAMTDLPSDASAEQIFEKLYPDFERNEFLSKSIDDLAKENLEYREFSAYEDLKKQGLSSLKAYESVVNDMFIGYEFNQETKKNHSNKEEAKSSFAGDVEYYKIMEKGAIYSRALHDDYFILPNGRIIRLSEHDAFHGRSVKNVEYGKEAKTTITEEDLNRISSMPDLDIGEINNLYDISKLSYRRAVPNGDYTFPDLSELSVGQLISLISTTNVDYTDYFVELVLRGVVSKKAFSEWTDYLVKDDKKVINADKKTIKAMKDLGYSVENKSDVSALVESKQKHFDKISKLKDFVESNSSKKSEYFQESAPDTIDINGVQKPTRNSNGDLIGKDEQSIRNFYNWFGDSKVVDEQGRPLVVYHGSNKEFSEFSRKLLGSSTDAESARQGFFFTDNEYVANTYGNWAKQNEPIKKLEKEQRNAERANNWDLAEKIEEQINELRESLEDAPRTEKLGYTYSVYLLSKKPRIFDARGLTFGVIGDEINQEISMAKSMNNDSLIIRNLIDEARYDVSNQESADHFLVFNPNQIKSVENIGTYSKESDNIYQQKPKGFVKGSYNASYDYIKLTKYADYSSLPHEFAHRFLQNSMDYINSGNASEEYTARYDDMYYEFAQKGSKGQINVRDTQEYFARQYERYLAEGLAESESQKEIFNDFERWLKAVYNDVNIPESEPLSQAQVDYFNSHITDTLPEPVKTPVIYTHDEEKEKVSDSTGLEKEATQEPAIQEKQEPDVQETERESDVVYVYSKAREDKDGKKSRVYAKGLQLSQDDPLLYATQNNSEIMATATDLVFDNELVAKDFIDGKIEKQDGWNRTAIMLAYEEKMLSEGNYDEYDRVRRMHSLEQTERGQEIQAEKLGTQNILDIGYWLNTAEKIRQEKAFDKLGFTTRGGETKGQAFYRELDARIKHYVSLIENGKSYAEVAKMIEAETGVEYFQKESYDKAYDFVKDVYTKTLELEISTAEQKNLIKEVEKLQNKVDRVNPRKEIPLEVYKSIDKIRDLHNQLNPSNSLSVLNSVVRRTSMLVGVGTIGVNIISNEVNALSEQAVRRAKYQATEKLVDKDVKKQFSDYASEVYKASGISVTTIPSDKSLVQKFAGENVISTSGKGAIRWVGRWGEKYIFKYALGYPDNFFKTLAFNDTADLLATKKARAMLGKDASKEDVALLATKYFKDATLIEPITEQGKDIRAMAILEAEISTYTNDSKISRGALNVRKALNDITGAVKLGDVIMPFVATPANVASLGLQYAGGIFGVIPNIPAIATDIRTGKMSSASRESIAYATRNALGAALAYALAGLFDEEDYIPPYEMCDQKTRDLVYEKNGAFNSIRVGDVFVSLDFLGAFGTPFVGALMAKKDENYASFVKGIAYQTAQTPGIEQIANIGKFLKEKMKNSDEVSLDIMENALDYARSYIPNIGKAVYQAVAQTEKRPRLQSAEWSATSGILRILAGARIKLENKSELVNELSRLNESGNGASIGNVVKNKAFKDLSEDKQKEISEAFVGEYARKALRLIQSSSYARMTDDEKKKALNKIRAKEISRLKNTL